MLASSEPNGVKAEPILAEQCNKHIVKRRQSMRGENCAYKWQRGERRDIAHLIALYSCTFLLGFKYGLKAARGVTTTMIMWYLCGNSIQPTIKVI